MATGLGCLSKTLRMLLLTYTSNTNGPADATLGHPFANFIPSEYNIANRTFFDDKIYNDAKFFKIWL